MRIQHNIMAMNAYRNLGTNNSALSKNLEKLSSGFRINRAGDDAAGLAISEKMRAQIAGLDQAQKNAQSGINLVQTAEGALTEVHDMLNRMVTLATQAANGTYESTDRSKLQAEVDALVEEIDRIADNSNFNGTKLLDGSLGSAAKITTTEAKAPTTAPVKASFKVDISALTTDGIATGEVFKIGGTNVTTGTSTTNSDADEAWNAIKTAIGSGKEYTIDSQTYVVTTGTDNQLIFTQKAAADYDVTAKTATIAAAIVDNTTAVAQGKITDAVKGVTGTNDGVAATTVLDFTGLKGEDVIGTTITIDGKTYEFVETDGDQKTGNTAVVVAKTDEAAAIATAFDNADAITSTTATAAAADGKVTVTMVDATAEALEATQAGSGLTLQIGADTVETIAVSVDSMKADALSIKGLSIGTVSDANAAIKTINDAIETVSVQRGNLGAIQNRLEHTINNLGVMEENIQDAEANIRDTDIADEMMAYTKNNILIQSAQAMLAQANQVPQGVLQLMQ